mmetsp:Transcript_18251/g.38297  ORF Transcript_18251/g.38297 Transcript_18251/m.38297 type:complete len:231 (-) Transcript_18251:147-839(-)
MLLIKLLINTTNTCQNQMSIHPLRHLNLIMIHPIKLYPPIHIRPGHYLPLLIPKTKIPIEKIALNPIRRSGFEQPRHAKAPFPLHVNIERIHKTDEFLLHPTDFGTVDIAVEIVGGSGGDEDTVHGDERLTRGGRFDAHFVFSREVEHGASDADEVSVLVVCDFYYVEVFACKGDWSLLDRKSTNFVLTNRGLFAKWWMIWQIFLAIQFRPSEHLPHGIEEIVKPGVALV